MDVFPPYGLKIHLLYLEILIIFVRINDVLLYLVYFHILLNICVLVGIFRNFCLFIYFTNKLFVVKFDKNTECDETWIYFYDMQTKQQRSKWIFEDEVPDTIPKQFTAVGKRMFAIFFTTRGLLEFVMLPAKHNVTSAWYTEICLPKVFQAVEKLRPKFGVRGMKFHHDNAPAHTAGKTKDKLFDM